MRKHYKLLYSLLILLGLTFLFKTESFISIYLLVSMIGLVLVNKIDHNMVSVRGEGYTILFAAILSFMVLTSNYKLYSITNIKETILTESDFLAAVVITIKCVSIVLGMFIAFFYILKWFEKMSFSIPICKGMKNKPIIFGIRWFIIFSVLYLIILFTGFYPGIMSTGSIAHVEEALGKMHNPGFPIVYQTIINVCIRFGEAMFGSTNGAVAVYSIFLIVVMTVVFLYAITTLYEISVEKKY